MAALWFKRFLLVSLPLMVMPYSHGMADGFQGGIQAKYSLEQGGIQTKSSSRKLLTETVDYDPEVANSKHDLRRKSGSGKP
ncbi:hypothetical protein PTKIN_Ptkin05aG0093900 [Pterospermum kingtungense]